MADDLERQLAAVLPGVSILDRELELGSGPPVDLCGLGERGELVLVRVVDELDEHVAERALAVLAAARRDLGLVLRHLAEPRLSPLRDPRLVLVADEFDPETAGRLGPLLGESVLCFERRRVRSERGTTVHLAPVGAPSTAAGVADEESFLRATSSEERELIEAFRLRLARVDRGLDLRPGIGALAWSLAGEAVVSIARDRRGLEVVVSGGVGGPWPLRAEGDLEVALEAVVARYLELLEEGGEELDELPEAENLRQVELVPHDSGVILTPEELAAFHD